MSFRRESGESGFWRRPVSRPRSYRPRLEQLEDRTVPANSFFNLPGTPDQFVTVRFNLTSLDTDLNNEVGVYVVDDAQGTVNGVAPGATGYARAALRDDNSHVLFDSGTAVGNQRILSFQGGSRLAFYLISGSTSSTFLGRNPTNRPGTGFHALFSVDAANADGLDHVARDKESGPGEFRWEDLLGGGDLDYNDVIYRARVLSVDAVPREEGFRGRALMTPGNPAQTINTTFRLVRREGAGEVGLFQVDNSLGHIGGLKPGDPGYLRAALDASRRNVLFATGQPAGNNKSLDLAGGSFFGLYVIDRGSAAGFLAANPGNAPGGSPNALVSFLGANPGQQDHMRQLYDRLVGFETEVGGSDPDYRDVVLQFGFNDRAPGTPSVPSDTTNPILAARLANDLGTSPNDGVTSDPTIVGSVSDLGGLAALRAGFGATADTNITDLVQADGSFQIDINRLRAINGGTLPEGEYRLRLQATDQAGNTSFFDVNFRFLSNPNAVGAIANQNVTAGTSVTLNLFNNFTGPALSNTHVKYDWDDFGDVDLELFDVNAPQGGRTTPGTVQNFLNYINSGRYQNSIMQRVPDGFVAQGGGFFFPTSNPNLADGVNPLDRVPTFAPVNGEVGNDNLPGTIAMALSGDPPNQNSGTSQYFINLRTNANLDPDFSAFGRVTSGLTVLTQDIEAVPTYRVTNVTGNEASMPLLNIPNPPGSTVDISNLTIDNFVILRDMIVTQRRDQLQFSATSSNTSVATVQLDPTKPNFLNITGVAAGTATITVTALGPSGSVTSTFEVTVA